MDKKTKDSEWRCDLCGLVFYEKQADRFTTSNDLSLPEYSCEGCWGALMRFEKNLATKALETETVSGIEKQ